MNTLSCEILLHFFRARERKIIWNFNNSDYLQELQRAEKIMKRKFALDYQGT
jgi:hypothetical protein